jgi:hypothetical protein
VVCLKRRRKAVFLNHGPQPEARRVSQVHPASASPSLDLISSGEKFLSLLNQSQ